MQVGHALNLLAELPEWLEDGRLPKHPRHAVAESFAMNCRILDEFFWNTSSGDIGRRDYETSGNLTVKRPKAITETVSKHVARLARARLDDPLVTMT